MKSVFLVLGAQRSGTSVTSHVLSEFGIDFGNPQHFLQDNHNPIFFELKWVNDLNNRIIERLGYRYTDFFLPIESDFQAVDFTDIEQTIHQQIQQEWGEKPAIGIKDPRFSLTLPIWEQYFRKQGYSLQIVFAIRSPANFLRSNQRLFHNWSDWDTQRHLNFWLQLNLAAVYFTRHLPTYYLSYDDLMSAPAVEVDRLATFLQLDRQKIPHAIDAVDNSHFHHQADQNTGDAWVDTCYQLLCSRQASTEMYLDFRNAINNGLQFAESIAPNLA